MVVEHNDVETTFVIGRKPKESACIAFLAVSRKLYLNEYTL